MPRDGDICSCDSIEIYLCSDQEGLDEAGVAKMDQYHLSMINARDELSDGYKSTSDRHSDRRMNFDIDYKVKPMGNGCLRL